jgi:hypothetical protein
MGTMGGSRYMLEELLQGPGAILLLIGQAFWLWMLIDCMKSEGPRSEWRYILFFGNVAGALAYFVVRWLPNNPVALPGFMRRWTHGQKLWNAKAATRNIGNAHQYAILGDVHYEMGDLKEAQQAYQTALDKDPKHTNALWGMAQVALQNKTFDTAKTHLQTLLKIDPEARFGEASLLYGKALFELKEWPIVKPHLEHDIRQWSHPESSLMLATILIQDGEKESARDRLETMLARVEASPMYHHRKHQPTLRKAHKMLKGL